MSEVGKIEICSAKDWSSRGAEGRLSGRLGVPLLSLSRVASPTKVSKGNKLNGVFSSILISPYINFIRRDC